MNEVNQRILEKIKRCLALSKSSNENEAATALRQAHAMMEKYNVGIDDIELSNVVELTSDAVAAMKPFQWEVNLAHLVARLFGCKPFTRHTRVVKNGKRKYEGRYIFMGYEMYATIATYAFNVLSRQLRSARLKYLRTALKCVTSAQDRQARADMFCHGWVCSVEGLVKNIVPPNVDIAMIQKKFNSLEMAKRKCNDNSDKAKNHKDFQNGINEGKNARLHHGMNSNTPGFDLLAGVSGYLENAS